MGEADLGARLRAAELHQLARRDRLVRRGVLVAEGKKSGYFTSIIIGTRVPSSISVKEALPCPACPARVTNLLLHWLA